MCGHKMLNPHDLVFETQKAAVTDCLLRDNPLSIGKRIDISIPESSQKAYVGMKVPLELEAAALGKRRTYQCAEELLSRSC